jgi:glutamate carboxypeptidase
MQGYAPYLAGLASQTHVMADFVADWVEISSGSHDVKGLAALSQKIRSAFEVLGGTVEELDLPPQTDMDASGQDLKLPLGKALRFRKRPNAPLQVFLGIHMDVVYGSGVTPKIRVENGIMYACGAADAKGGLVILLKALEAFEASPFATNVGWEVLLNPDEELSSPGSRHLLAEAASRNHLGLLFEPSLPNGNIVGARKGSGNFIALVRGRAAHAGRDPHLGRNAIHALAHFIVALESWGKSQSGITVNVGKIEGGGPLNRVPDLAIGRFNIRVSDRANQMLAENFLLKLTEQFSLQEGISLEIKGGFSSPPKPMTASYQALLEAVKECGDKLGMTINWEDSGGVSDGNKLAALGLPNVDTMGAMGGKIHSSEEFLVLDSLVERATLTALLLMRLGSGELKWFISPDDKNSLLKN